MNNLFEDNLLFWSFLLTFAAKQYHCDSQEAPAYFRYSIETVVIGAQQYTKPHGEGKADVFADAIKHDHKSKNPTTRWSGIIELK